MHLCPRLVILQSSRCGITSDDLKQLFEQLTNSPNYPFGIIVKWDLSYNQIDDSGAATLMAHLLSLFPDLAYCLAAYEEYITHFSGNHISSKMVRRMSGKEMKRCIEVIVMYACSSLVA